jgi:hypothetical protein
MPELTPKQAKFAEEYCLSRNGTAAAIRAKFYIVVTTIWVVLTAIAIKGRPQMPTLERKKI